MRVPATGLLLGSSGKKGGANRLFFVKNAGEGNNCQNYSTLLTFCWDVAGQYTVEKLFLKKTASQ